VDKAPDAFRTISEVADDLDVPQHVLRFWETRFPQIKPMKRGGGRRYYRPDDVDLLRGIRHLLYGEGYTIRGVQRLLKDNGPRFVQAVWRPESATPEPVAADANGADSEDDVEETVAEVDDVEDASPAEPPVAPRAPSATWSRANISVGAPPARSEPPAEKPAKAQTAPPSPSPREAAVALSREDVQKLQAALYELGECRRLLDAAFKDE
jgi:DNA-binding transcriptional MerR regulator